MRQFELAFAGRFGLKHAVMVNSGSSANLVAVAALCYKKDRPLRRGDDVDQDIDATEGGQHRFDGVLHLATVGDIAQEIGAAKSPRLLQKLRRFCLL